MKLTAEEFLAQPKKAITLMGMSGVGKSYTASKLAEWGWTNFSCDYVIGTKYLQHLIADSHDMSEDDISWLSDFVGRLGALRDGGLPLEKFQKRQKLYYEAEVDVVRDAVDAVSLAARDVVIDSSGSLCEIEDEDALEALGQKTVFVYLKVRQQGHAKILERASTYPKPLYFPPSFLQERLARYLEKFDLSGVGEIDPDEFLRWIFPHLFEARLPKYQALAEKYGVVVPSHEVDLSSKDAFIQCIAKALDG
ncbi:MAG: hypothetical protein AAF204_00480 [Pseudomonadota bacterium]